MSKLRELADVHYGKSPNEVTSIDGPYPVFGTGGIYGLASRALFHGPAIVVPRKGSLGNPHFVGSPFWASDTTYAVVPKPKVDAKWLYYSLDAFDLTKLNEATGVPSINRDWLYRINLGNQEFDQQRRIAEILTTVDEAMEQTEALVGKLEQMKAGLMHDLFTRGVTPDGHLRPTRQEAPHLYHPTPLGWLPKEWGVNAFGGLFDTIYRYPTYYGIEYVDSGVVEVRGEMLNDDGSISDDARHISEQTASGFPRVRLEIGDIVMSVRGTIGKTGIITSKQRGGVITANMLRLKPEKSKVISDWVFALMRTLMFADALDKACSQTTIKTIQMPALTGIPVGTPSLTEQATICERISAMLEKVTTEREHLDKLRQQKQGLMQDLLTGRVRVA